MKTRKLRSYWASGILLSMLTLLAACGGSDTGKTSQSGSALTAAVPPVQAPPADTFGLTSDSNFFIVDTGAGLVFKIRRLDNGVSTQSAGDIASLIYNGVQYQDQSRGSQVNSGFDYLYTGISAVTVNADVINTDYIRVTVQAGNLTHYYLAKRGNPHIYMGTYFTSEPDTLNLVRYIVRVPVGVLPFGPGPSDLRNNTGAIESGDIFGMANGETRSKHYSNMRLKDWSYIGGTSSSAGLWMVRDNNEGGSGGPFFRSLLNQITSTNQEITYIVNYGENQTEAYRPGILNTYTLVFTNGAAPGTLDTSWFANMGMSGYTPSSARGAVAGTAINGRNTSYGYTVGFSNTTAQYWATANASNGSFSCPNMIPGTYTMKIYKNELAVDTRTVTVNAGSTFNTGAITITGDPSSSAALWRIGDWDGTPAELLNGDKVTTMHPSDVRMSSWVPGNFVIGSSTAAANFPAYQWKSVNGSYTIKFNLTASQITDHTLRVGITTAYAGGRPKAQMNAWVSANPAASTQPSSRTLTVGSYRGNNTMYTFAIPASAFVIGENTLTLTAISGSSGTTYLSPGYSYDAVDLLQ